MEATATYPLLEDCLDALRRRVVGEVRSDAYNRMFYSTDASIYQVTPLAVVIPRERADIQAVVETAAEFGVPVLPRASGSSLAGQAVAEAIVVDCTRHLNAVLEIDVEARTARVEPGLVLGTLNRRLKPLGLQFGPDPASANRAAMGGIVANNSTGAHSIVYGMTADHVVATEVVLSDGSRAVFSNLDETEVQRKSGSHTLEGRIYAGLSALVGDPANREAIRSGTPRHWRRCGGYNLDRLARGGHSFRVEQHAGFNLASLVCGSEGTLAFMEDITLRLVPLPAHTGLAIVHFDSLRAALESVPEILTYAPSAVELLDHLGMSMCRQVPAWRRRLERFVDGDPNCVLITEFYGDSETEMNSRIESFRKGLDGLAGASSIVSITDSAGQNDVWSVRKMGLGFLMSLKGDHKPIPFIEDAAVPPESLAEYVTKVEEFCAGLGTKVAYYAHASAGCVHIRPLINTKSAEEVARLPEITSFAIDLLHGFGGSLSSEHGDGRARSVFNERFFGPELYGLYREVKKSFDPGDLFNPGNIINAGPMTEHLRFGPSYSTRPVKTHLDFSVDQGFDRAVEMCNGAGVCRKIDTETMCPSFMATREEEHSTRGRANALRAALSGSLYEGGITDDRLLATLDLCLMCKACASECPSSVDMSRLKMEVLAQYYDAHGVPRRTRALGHVAELNRRLSGWRAAVANAFLRTGFARRLLEKTHGIHRRRTMPPFAVRPFTNWFDSRTDRARSGKKIALFNDTFNTYNYPEVAIAATRFLEACGYEVLLTRHGCCGRPLLSKGLVEDARLVAAKTLESLIPLVDEGIEIVGLEPSCLLSIDDEYRALFPGDDRIDRIWAASSLFDEFVARLAMARDLPVAFADDAAQILVHGHCHQKSHAGMDAARVVLELPEKYSARVVDSGCCGMAGSFGFEREHYNLSMQIGEDRLFPAIRESEPDTIVCASGVSCRQQIEAGTGRLALHPAEILWKALAQVSG